MGSCSQDTTLPDPRASASPPRCVCRSCSAPQASSEIAWYQSARATASSGRNWSASGRRPLSGKASRSVLGAIRRNGS